MLRPTPLFPGRGCARRSADLIRRSDFSDVAEVPEEFTENQLRDAHNDIVRRLRPGRVIASALVAVLASPLFGGLVVETHAKGSWPNTSNIVTSVSWEGGPGTDTNSVRGVVDSSFAGGTNAVNAAVSSVGSMSNSWNRVAETVGSMSNSWNRAGSDATNYTDSATNALRLCDGAARPLPKYLHAIDFADSYPDAAQEYYRSRGNGKTDGGCSAVRDGGYLYRNFDYPFDDRAEFVVKMSAGPNRFASVGVAQVGTNLTEQMVTSGKPSRCYKWLPGATVDGINENGVVAEINVVDTPVTGWHTTGDLHPLAAIRHILDHATNAQSAAEYIAANIRFPAGWAQNFHYMIADATSTYIVENGTVTDGDEYHEPDEPVTMTNFQLSKFPWDGMGMERFGLLLGGANITNAWYTNAYRRETNPPWVSDLADVIAYTNEIFDAWASHPKEYFRGKTNNGIPWWQSVHTSIYDFAAKTLRVAVQETDNWYTFQVPMSGGLKAETDPTVPAWAKTDNPPVIPSSANPGYAKNADYARSAGTANTATRANSAGTADYAGRADEAAVADEAEFAKYATEATSAGSADNANHAATADNATVASHATTSEDSYAARKVEDSQYPGLSIAPNRNGANDSWVVKDTDHPNGFRLQPTDLSDYYTKAQADTNAAEIANHAISTNSLTTNLTARLAEKIGGGDVPSFEQDPTATAKANAAIATNEATTNLIERMAGKLDKITGNPSTYFGNYMTLNTRVDGLKGTIYQTDAGKTYPLSTFNLEYCSINSSYRSDRETAGIVTYGDGGVGFGIAPSKSDFDDGRYSMFYGDGWIGDSFGRYIEIPRDADGTLALVSQIEDATNGLVSASNPAFSNAVLAVGLNIDADTLQWLKDIGAIAQSTTGQVGLGTLLAALLAALMWLKNNKADKGELPYMTDLGGGRYEYTGALTDASTRTYPREDA